MGVEDWVDGEECVVGGVVVACVQIGEAGGVVFGLADVAALWGEGVSASGLSVWFVSLSGDGSGGCECRVEGALVV